MVAIFHPQQQAVVALIGRWAVGLVVEQKLAKEWSLQKQQWVLYLVEIAVASQILAAPGLRKQPYLGVLDLENLEWPLAYQVATGAWRGCLYAVSILHGTKKKFNKDFTHLT